MLTVTYERWTPDDTEQGDTDDRGFIEPRFGLEVPVVEALTDDWPRAELEWTLPQVEARFGRTFCEDSGRWFTAIDPTENYRTGERVFYSFHPADSVTPSSYERLARVLEWRRNGRH